MTLKLTDEQRAALVERGAPIVVEDAETHRIYFLVDPAMFESLQDNADLAALTRGADDADAGRTTPLDEAIRRIEGKLRARFAS